MITHLFCNGPFERCIVHFVRFCKAVVKLLLLIRSCWAVRGMVGNQLVV